MTISDSLIGVIYGMCLFHCGYFVLRVSLHIIFHTPHAFVRLAIERVKLFQYCNFDSCYLCVEKIDV